jgi:hypothetical protein
MKFPKITITILLLVVSIISSCGTRSKKAPEEKSRNQYMWYVNRNLVNKLTQLTSGYIETSNDTILNQTYVRSVIKLPKTIDFDFVNTYITVYLNQQKDLGVSIFQPWTRNKEYSYPFYVLGLTVDEYLKNDIY